eukprot:GSChrysophyteH1.ASY1.ANO1.217.1 assembled CDS
MSAEAADFDDWRVSLFMWRSENLQHTALLPNSPETYFSSANVEASAAVLASNYSMVFKECVALAHALPEDESLSYPLVSLNLYYSAERADLQTTTWSLSQLNAHGGNYEFVQKIAALALTPGSGYTASSYVPLTVSYCETCMDTATSPLSAADLNLLLPGVSPEAAYRTGGAIIGFAAWSSCPWCSVTMSETFPSAGGADCAYPCNQYGRSGEANFLTTYDLGEYKDEGSKALKRSMEAADEVILQFGHKDVTVTPRSRGTHIHMSFNYFCCYQKEDLKTLHAVLEGFDWPEVQVSFDKPTIRIDSDANDVSHYSFILLLDEKSQKIVHDVMSKVEAAVRGAGVDVHVPRSQQEPFHSTLAVVNGLDFPAAAALQAVNAAVPPGTWTAGHSITLQAPTWN